MKRTLTALLIALVASVSMSAQSVSTECIRTNTFWHNWFVRGGVDMTLVNAYGRNFANVFPKGKTFGIVALAGKWFTPQVGLDLRLKIENNIVRNNHLEWIGPLDADGRSTNYSEGGFIDFTIEVPLSITDIFWQYDPDRTVRVMVFPRAGLISNLATNSASPLVGGGVSVTYRLDHRWSLYATAAYQATTSEFYDANSTTGMSVSTGSNGFFDFELGVQFDLGGSRCTDFKRY